MEMDTVTFLTTGWQNINLEAANSEVVRIEEALTMNMKDGMVFEQMVEENADEGWRIINVDLAWVEERKSYKRAEWANKRNQRWMVNVMQKELNILRNELSKTRDGKKVLESLRKCYADQRAELGPLQVEVEREDITAGVKKATEKELMEKHLVFRKRFQECFNRATALKILVGQPVVNFYFDELPGSKVSLSYT